MFFCCLAPRRECLWHSKISSLVIDTVLRKIGILLDPDRPFGGDYKTLASAFGYEQMYVTYLGKKPNPTEVLLQAKDPTLFELRHLLLREDMKRSEVVKVIEEWIKANCPCQDCGSLR